jgi:Uma2 family endonuclease
MAKRDVVLTYKDYEALPEDGRRYEIHDGELSVTPAPSPQHQMVSRNLFRILDGYVRARGIGEILSHSTGLIDRSTERQLSVRHALAVGRRPPTFSGG